MSDITGKYKQIMNDLEENIKDPQELNFVKDKFSDLSMLFIDMLDRVTRLTDIKIQEIENKQKEIISKMDSVQAIVNEIESDIYEDDENYEFEIVCPYCNYEFTTDIDNEDKDEIICPECHNTIELDWNLDEELEGCSGSCSHCHSSCVAEDEQEYNVNEHTKNGDNEEDEDM